MADTALKDLDMTSVEQNLQTLKALLQDAFPSMDLTPGTVFYELVLTPAAQFHTLEQTNLAEVENARSLKLLIETEAAAPGTVSDELVDQAVSNFNITRQSGTYAAGQITVVTTSNVYLPVGTSVVFTAGSQTYRPSVSFAGVSSSASVSDEATDLIFTQRSDGTYAITIDVTAENTGEAGNIAKDTVFTVTPSLTTSVVTLYAAGDFSGGSDTETSAQLLERLPNGLASKSPASRASIKALLQENFAGVTDVSVIGAGDEELQRGSLLSIKHPGVADVYVRTRSRPIITSTTVSASLVDPLSGTWTVTFTRDQYPGLYRVSMYPTGEPEGATALETLEVTRTVDSSHATDLDFTPSLTDEQAVFTRYQVFGITFKDLTYNATGDAAGTKRDYTAVVTYMPSLDTINDWLMARDRRPLADYLVKAPLPCFVSCTVGISQGRGDPALSATQLQQIKDAAAAAVNAVDFAEGRLDASVIIDAIQPLLPRRTRVVSPIDLRGTILLPDGTEPFLYNRNVLIVPSRYDLMCSPRTTAFYLDPNDVLLDVETSNALPV